MLTKLHIGYLKYFDSDKKSGFVQVLDGSYQEIYTHQRYFDELLQKGDNVQFYIKENKFGWLAVSVKKYSKV